MQLNCFFQGQKVSTLRQIIFLIQVKIVIIAIQNIYYIFFVLAQRSQYGIYSKYGFYTKEELCV